ncbi:class I SAM-dependent methyltransferase [Streptomyces sp. NPDC056231]|uniref:class I SAM-dependent methyltransferase n=1 Tax=Streptomyces sp. NPDC056231 TaxID=3345755 RepID=UPI003AADE652
MTSWPRFADTRLFVTEAARGFRITGAVAPSSRRLAGALAAPVIERAGQPLDVLEVGAGTGPVTRCLLPLLAPGSTLDVVEANPRFADVLRSVVREYRPGRGEPAPHAQMRDCRTTHTKVRDDQPGKAFVPVRSEGGVRVSIHETRIEHLNTRQSYDVIVSGLPFTNFVPGTVAALMDRYFELLRPGGSLTYFAYVATAPARRFVASAGEAARHRSVESVLAGYRQRGRASGRTVWANVPPARVWHVRPTPSPARNGTLGQGVDALEADAAPVCRSD